MTNKHRIVGPNFVPSEKLLQWNNYEYGKCWIKIDGLYYPFYAARYLDTKRYTYADSEDELLDIMDAAHQYEKYDTMPKLKRYMTKKVKELTRKPTN